MKSEAHTLLEIHMQELGLHYIPEFTFFKPRKWRFDYLVWVELRPYAIEIEGGIWSQGRHTRGSGRVKDIEKYRTAALLGYAVVPFTTEEVLSGKAKEILADWLPFRRRQLHHFGKDALSV